MKKRLVTAVALAGVMCLGSFADLSQFGASAGWMHVYDNDSGSQGGYLWGSGWGIADLQAITTNDATYQLLPNVNTYADNPGDAYWRDNGGNGPDGNKWMEANAYREYTLQAGETNVTLNYSVSAFNLNGRYDLDVFIKTLDPGAGYSQSGYVSADISSAVGSTALNFDSTGLEGHILQIGFVMNGLNANPADDWGSATATFDSVEVIPEPATIILVGVMGGGLLFTRRNLKIN